MTGFRLLFTMGAVVLPLSFAGCKSSEDDSQKKNIESFGKKIEKDIKNSQDPLFAVPRIKKYASEMLEDITDDEDDFIEANPPEITSNYNGTMYAFVWKFEKHRMIEVLTSSAPFEPVAVYRVSKVYFP